MSKILIKYLFLVASAILFVHLLDAQAGVLYVQPNGTGNGSTWSQAFGDFQEAIETAASHPNISQVWVAYGTYNPTGHPNIEGFRIKERHFSLRNGVAIYGGFAGIETDLSQRNIEHYPTILSGAIDQENTYHVFFHPEGINLDSSAVLDGFTITGGKADGDYPHNSGGGIYNRDSSPTLNNLIIINNSSAWIWNKGGAGIYNFESNPILTNVSIIKNSGEGILNSYSDPQITNSIISDNNLTGIKNISSHPILNHVTIKNNKSTIAGMKNEKSNPTLINVSIIENSGQGMSNYYSNPNLNNVKITNNYSGISNFHSEPKLNDIVISNNGGQGIYNTYSNPILTDVKIIDNGYYGIENYKSDPTLNNVIIRGNYAGIRNHYSDLIIKNVTIENNSGEGIYNIESNPELNNVNINNNGDSWWTNAGGIYNEKSNPILENVTISNNNTPSNGGGIHNNQSNPTLTNVTISGNSAGEGGGVYNHKNSNPTIINCTITGNSAIYGGGIFNKDSKPIIKNTILWGNTASVEGNELINEGTSSPIVSWSIIKGPYVDGTNTITENPLLSPLADNGGYTKTHAIPLHSPAYAIPQNAGVNNWNGAPDKDQRGITRTLSSFRAIGAYEDSFGNLQVFIDPIEAEQAGAQWRRTGTTTWRNSGYTETNVPIGTYTIEFKVFPGWRPEGTNTVIVEANKTAIGTGSYFEQTTALPGVMMLLLDE